MERRARLGDVIDDYCTRCRMLMNHGIVGMVGDDVAKVRCNTCQFEHAYKHGRIPKRRRGETDRLFAEVLRGIRGEPDAAASAEPDEEPEAASEERPEAAATVTGRTGAAARQARAAAGHPKAAGHAKAAARHGRKGAAPAGGKTTRPRSRSVDEDEAPEEHEETAADFEDRADTGRNADPGGDSGTDGEAQQAGPQAEEPSAPERDEDSEPTHGVRRKLFTIRRHSGGKPPVAGVTTDGSAERAARGQAQQQQGGQGRFGRGGHGGGGRHGQGGHGGHGGHGGGGRPDQQGRWPRRHRRRG
ncbi:MAG TPA: hypothetical protein VFQ07_14855 [Candidatus Polarisedimenticolia bacterium]|nr:hypothetical protein [Candidatus Polarisedimenticolia bacterium]